MNSVRIGENEIRESVQHGRSLC